MQQNATDGCGPELTELQKCESIVRMVNVDLQNGFYKSIHSIIVERKPVVRIVMEVENAYLTRECAQLVYDACNQGLTIVVHHYITGNRGARYVGMTSLKPGTVYCSLNEVGITFFANRVSGIGIELLKSTYLLGDPGKNFEIRYGCE